MVFKRYIKKHGKKLGPYYYHNIRGNDGKIKTVYVGTNPGNHPKHKIRKPLFFLILALLLILILGGSLFLLQNKSVLLKQSQKSEPDFDVDQILLKVLVKSGDYLEKQIRVMNTGNEPTSIAIEISSVSDIVSVDSASFSLKPGQTKIVALNFSSINSGQKIEQQPGIYVGKLVLKSEKSSREIPAVVEIETKDVLFDMNLNPVAIERRVRQGEDTTIEVKVFNLESIESVNVDVAYFVKDMNGNTIVTESETVVVKTQASFFKTISIPKNLKPGTYVFAAQAKFGKSVGTSSYMFEVIGPDVQRGNFVTFCESSILCLGLSMTTVLLIIAVIAYFYFYVGAYLYETVTGKRTLPKKKREEIIVEEAPIKERKTGIFSKFLGKLKKWQREREKDKLQTEGIERQRQLEKLEQERIIQLDAVRKHRELERQALEELKMQELVKRHKELEARSMLDEENKKRAEEETKKEEERKLRKQEKKKRKAEMARMTSAGKKRLKELLHNIGFYKTAEEKRQTEIQKEKEIQEKLKIKEEQKKQKELEEKRKKDEGNKIEAEQERRRQEEARQREIEEKKRADEENKKRLEEGQRKKNEEIAKQQELRKLEQEKKKRELMLQKQRELEEERKKLERRRLEEKQKQVQQEEIEAKEEQRKKKELEARQQEELRKRKMELIKQLSKKLAENKNETQKFRSELDSTEAGIRVISNKIIQINSEVKSIGKELEEKSIIHDKVLHQKSALIQNHQHGMQEITNRQNELEKKAEAKKEDIRKNLAQAREKLNNEMQRELGKLPAEKRKDAEKWRKIEINARLKLEEQKLLAELKDLESIVPSDTEKEQEYKDTLGELIRDDKNIRKVMSGLKQQKSDLEAENDNSSDDLRSGQNKAALIRKRIEMLENERMQIKKELSIANFGLSRLRLHFVQDWISGFAEKRRRRAEAQEKEKLRLQAEKQKLEQVLLKRKKLEDAQNRRKEEQLKKEEQKKAEREEKARQLEEKLKFAGERKKQNEIVKEKAKVKPEDDTQKNLSGKSGKFVKCSVLLESSKKALNDGNKSKAKALYAEAREVYVGLDYNEKKEVYNDLMNLYDELLK